MSGSSVFYEGGAHTRGNRRKREDDDLPATFLDLLLFLPMPSSPLSSDFFECKKVERNYGVFDGMVFFRVVVV